MEATIEVQMVLVNQYGEFRGEIMLVNEEQCVKMIELSKEFYNSGFELHCEDGSFMVFPPEIVKYSVLKIDRKLIEKL
jgi:hypothetical protein